MTENAVNLIPSPWRATFEGLLRSVEKSLLMAVPFIKLDEVEWLTGVLFQGRDIERITLTVLTDLRPDSVLNGSLDVEALYAFGTRFGNSTVMSVPRLHAKVYVADRSVAVVTSANLTRAGLDENMEYGVQIDEPTVARRVAEDLLAYGRLGSPVPAEVLGRLAGTARSLTSEHQRLLKSAKADLRRRFDRQYRAAREEFIATQVGRRSANAVFSEAILYVLSGPALTTTELQPRIQKLLPDLCDDEAELIINGEHFGKKWKHQARNAQQALKRAGLVRFDGRRWHKV